MTPSLDLGGEGSREEGNPEVEECGVLEKLRECQHCGSSTSASKCSFSVQLEQTLETVTMLLAARCVAGGGTQGLEKGPRYTSELHPQVPPA